MNFSQSKLPFIWGFIRYSSCTLHFILADKLSNDKLIAFIFHFFAGELWPQSHYCMTAVVFRKVKSLLCFCKCCPVQSTYFPLWQLFQELNFYCSAGRVLWCCQACRQWKAVPDFPGQPVIISERHLIRVFCNFIFCVLLPVPSSWPNSPKDESNALQEFLK